MSAIDLIKTELSQATTGNVLLTIPGQPSVSVPIDDLATALGVTRTPPQPVIYQAKCNTPMNLRLHSAPNFDSNVIGSILFNEVVGVLGDAPVSADNYVWLRVQKGNGLTGYAAQQYLDKIVPSAPAPTTRRKLGIHCLQDARLAVDAWLASGARPTSATVVNDAGLANELAARGITTIYRFEDGNQAISVPTDPVAAQSYGHSIVAERFSRGQYASVNRQVYIQIENEDPWSAGHPAFWLGVLTELDARGYKGVIGAYGVGHVEVNEMQAMIPALEYAKTHGHIMALHAYCKDGTPAGQLSAPDQRPYYELRYKRLYAAVPPSARPPLVISEFQGEYSRGKFQGTDALISLCTAFEAAAAGDDYLIGYNVWTVGSAGGWGDACIDSALPNLLKWMNS